MLYLECRQELVKVSLVVHRQNQHSLKKGGSGQEGDNEGEGNKTRTFRMAFPAKSGLMPCPVKGCSGRSVTWTAIHVHLWHRHVRDTVVILEEGNLPHPWFPLCEMLVPQRLLNGMHRPTVQCRKGAERK